MVGVGGTGDVVRKCGAVRAARHDHSHNVNDGVDSVALKYAYQHVNRSAAQHSSTVTRA